MCKHIISKRLWSNSGIKINLHKKQLIIVDKYGLIDVKYFVVIKSICEKNLDNFSNSI